MKYIKTCPACGKQFETNNPQKMYCNGRHFFPCPVCGKLVEKKDRDFARPHRCCSSKCSHELRKRNFKTRVCIECGKEFIPSSGSETICSGEHIRICIICGNKFKASRSDIQKNVTTCCHECSVELQRKHNIEKYGVEHPMQLQEIKEKQQDTMEDRYGVRHALQSEEIKSRAIKTNIDKFGVKWILSDKRIHDKIKQTILEKYGAKTTLQSQELSDKVKKTNIERYWFENPAMSQTIRSKILNTNINLYGTSCPLNNKEIQERYLEKRKLIQKEITDKAKKTFMNRYRVDNPSKNPEIMKKIERTMIEHGYKHAMNVPEFKHKYNNTCRERYGSEWYVTSKKYSESSNIVRISKINYKFLERLQSEGIDISEKDMEFPLEGRCFDFHIPDTNILIEINPTYTHNSYWNHYNNKGIDKLYHLQKSRIAEENGYRCIHVFQWNDWDDIIDLIKPSEPIYARNCTVMRAVTKNQENMAKKFIEENHIQGNTKGTMSYIYLIHNDNIVMCITFGRPRYNKNYSLEILRMCTKKGYHIIGGASKMFKFATEYCEYDNILTYCDASKFTGKVYSSIGMNLIRHTIPNKIWSMDDKYITNNLLNQRGFDQLFKTDYGKDTNNEYLMLLNGWLPVYDCGQYVFEYRTEGRS